MVSNADTVVQSLVEANANTNAPSESNSSSPQLPKRFGWVGLGQMGYPMVTNLRRKLPRDRTLVVYDLDRGACERFVKDWEMDREKEETGAEVGTGVGELRIMGSAKEVTENSDCFISIVPEGSHVKAVYLTPETGALATNTAGKLFIDSSTIDTASSLEVGSAVHASSADPSSPALFFDAPVSGGTLGASKATLNFMVGSSPTNPAFPLVRSICSLMGASVQPIGGPSLGLAAKLSNNYLSGLSALATAEAMNLGMRLGIDPHVLKNVFEASSGSNYTNSKYNPVPGVCPEAPSSHGYEGGFKTQLMKKDMTLAVKAAGEVGARLILGNVGLGAYSEASEDPRFRDKDCRVMYRWLDGLEPRSKTGQSE
ncbi:hypothetical protein K435DRAFT_826045 [Dendrothele bispora CBS 962.96]|uniref:3-hydroxyisobutyrate dehydrogenase n=1 Tax=Dendrothele bispora (strain CBS 962.96) TaxID=1314807 RepID=A0A4S8MUY3_DENBC|nr:hypothetical protein K435DRAFT_826045 [Dendrothele bispora CBS 962.96]